ncbi:olfactory receptor 7A5-like [Dermochelys coriacea]|uniref:olfactory receptor 7A5-like n=1 Tax=Dermochelys coriacea TaxID=27794 RepID=UPI001CA8EEDF|nr:olfactory receptor 7A5-like [Dermochelys coriacea]
MDSTNDSVHPDLLLLGLTSCPSQDNLLFSLFLCRYLLNLLANLQILLLTRSDPRLHGSPMYFFLSHLSLVDICFTSTTMPKMLANLRARRQGIPYTGGLVQRSVSVAFAIPENFLLAVMAGDHYLALCRPLRYAALLSPPPHRPLLGPHPPGHAQDLCYSGDRDKLALVMYTVVTPTLNPFIYSLRHQDIKAALCQGLDRLRGAWWGWGRGSGESRLNSSVILRSNSRRPTHSVPSSLTSTHPSDFGCLRYRQNVKSRVLFRTVFNRLRKAEELNTGIPSPLQKTQYQWNYERFFQ